MSGVGMRDVIAQPFFCLSFIFFANGTYITIQSFLEWKKSLILISAQKTRIITEDDKYPQNSTLTYTNT